MRILTVLGTRPEIIRLSRVIPLLDGLVDHHVLHTMQNFDPLLNTVFFNELGIRRPDIHLDASPATVAGSIAKIFTGVEDYLTEFKPDKVLVLGDTNSALSAIICERHGIPVYHMEAGNRCWDLQVPEEINRRLIDTVCTVNMPYTNGSRENLLREGKSSAAVHVTGNPIKEVLDWYTAPIEDSEILSRLGLTSGGYILATAHRAENVDNPARLASIFAALGEIAGDWPVVFSCHPRTRSKLKDSGIEPHHGIRICDPFGFFDFVKLEKNCRLALTDSGTVQEEMCLFGIPTITIRNTTERPETVACGSNIVSGLDTAKIMLAYKKLLSTDQKWVAPPEYLKTDVSNTVANILLSNYTN